MLFERNPSLNLYQCNNLLVWNPEWVRLVAETRGVVGQFQLVQVNFQGLSFVLQIELELSPNLFKIGQLVPGILAFVLKNKMIKHSRQVNGNGRVRTTLRIIPSM